jgi:hypothetical protein
MTGIAFGCTLAISALGGHVRKPNSSALTGPSFTLRTLVQVVHAEQRPRFVDREPGLHLLAVDGVVFG